VHSLGAGSTLQSREFSLFLAVFQLQLGEPHPHVQLHRVHVLWTCDQRQQRKTKPSVWCLSVCPPPGLFSWKTHRINCPGRVETVPVNSTVQAQTYNFLVYILHHHTAENDSI